MNHINQINKIILREEFDRQYAYSTGTPMMKQYLDIKFQNQDCLVLFRMGDFYELFFDDAILVSRLVNIALAKRGKHNEKNLPMCGMPYHAVNAYLKRLISAGYKIAICDQMETPEEAKKRGYKSVVKREIVQIITPGTVMLDDILNTQRNNYICSINVHGKSFSICYIDVLTGDTYLRELNNNAKLLAVLEQINPNEILISENHYDSIISIVLHYEKIITTIVPSCFALSKCRRIVEDFYQIYSIDTIQNITNYQVQALGIILEYIHNTQKKNTPQLTIPKIIPEGEYINLDTTTLKNLEIFKTVNGQYQNSVISVINKTITKQGSRLLYQYLAYPLKHHNHILERQHIVNLFYKNHTLATQVRELLAEVSDIPLILSRISSNKGSNSDLWVLKSCIGMYNRIQDVIRKTIGLDKTYSNILYSTGKLDEVYQIILEALIVNDDGKITINSNYHPKINELRNLVNNQENIINKFKLKYRKMTGADNLKINSNNIIGMYVEVTNRNADKLQDEIFIHKQNTINVARFTTTELQDAEYTINNAMIMIANLEKELLQQIFDKVLEVSIILRTISEVIAKIDVFSTLGFIANNYGYIKPEITLDKSIDIIEGRHVVLERINTSQNFISNNCKLDHDKYMWLITGPNMSGKSTFLRQNAIIILLAQIGSFVPANKAIIGLVDQIFTRIGANDNLSSGASTFMVEMSEVAHILNQATEDSFIVLDEIGRGTSTQDGLAIAAAVTSYLHDTLKARNLLATHYHELSNLKLIHLDNYTTQILEENDKIIFGRKIIPGIANKSYGIYVAKLAGIAQGIIQDANNWLEKVETLSIVQDIKNDHQKNNQEIQTICTQYSKIGKIIEDINPNNLTPIQALELIYKMREINGNK